METTSLLEAFELADRNGKRTLLRSNQGVKGFSEQYFLRVAQLLGEDPEASEVLAESWDLVNRFGDDASYAWRAKGALERIRGRWLQSAIAFVKAGSLAESEVSKSSFQVGAIDSFARAGKTEDAVRLGQTIAEQLETLGEKALAGRAWLNTGNAFLWVDKHKDSTRCYEHAINCLSESPFRFELAAARLGLSSSALYIDYPSRSLQWAEQAFHELTELGAVAYADHAGINIGHCRLLMGQADEAIRVFTALRDKVEPESLEYARLSQFLGDAWKALEMFIPAGDAYTAALQAPGISQSPLNAANCWTGLGEVSLHQRQWKNAKRYLRSAKAKYLAQKNLPLADLTLISYARAELGLNRRKAADQILSDIIPVLRRRKFNEFLVDALLLHAEILRGQQRIDAIDEASRVIRRFGFVDQAWRVHALRAESASSSTEALRHYRKMVDAILVHRSRLSSVTGRTAILEPSLVSIRSYLQILIEQRTGRSQEEAINVVTTLRSVTVLDEFLSISKVEVPAEVLAVLQDIRAEAAMDTKNDLANGPIRQSGRALGVQPAILRAYLERIGVAKVRPMSYELPVKTTGITNTFVFLNHNSAWIDKDQTIPNKVTKDELLNTLRWVQFELLAPLSGFASDDWRLKEELAGLRASLNIDSLKESGDEIGLCVEDVAYQVPWPLDVPREPVIYLRPNGGISPSSVYLPPNPKIAVWHHPRHELPHIEQEVNELRALFGNVEVFCSREEILDPENQRHFDLIHIAAHGRFDPENPMFSSIELGDGHLLACDIARAGFQADIATLASCESASLGQPSGWEPQGLARAFLARKCKTVIGSLWPLNDLVALTAFRSFYEGLEAGKSVTSSMKHMRMKLRSEFDHPAYWGSLVMFGGYHHEEAS